MMDGRTMVSGSGLVGRVAHSVTEISARSPSALVNG